MNLILYHNTSNNSIIKYLLISIYIFTVIFVCTSPVAAQNQSMEIFEEKTDVGDIINKGSVIFNPESKTYLIAGSGQNMWFAKDAFHFVWKKVSGDISIASGINFTDTLGNNHKKAGVMIRESLDEDSPYIDAVIHGLFPPATDARSPISIRQPQ